MLGAASELPGRAFDEMSYRQIDHRRVLIDQERKDRIAFVPAAGVSV
jgi:hypothetical protein